MATVFRFVALLAVLPTAGSQQTGTSPGTSPLRKDRDASVTRKLVPKDELPMPPGWNWPEYLKQLKEKDFAGDEGMEMLPPGWKWDNFHSGVQVTELFMSLQKRCPSGLVTIYNAGFSQEGRSLKVLQIGARNDYDAASTSHLVPEVALSGNIHGDERASTEILLHLAWDLCRRYRHGDTEVIELLGTTSIHILPSINPDGSAKRQRQNAKGKDLDSEFPVIGLPRTVGLQQSELPIEVVNVMTWHLDHPFVLSASLHGGALVTSYPMDACDAEGREIDCPSEDDPLPLNLARAVADAHGRMSHMPSAYSSFDRGVTRGSQWSPILGGMQDWVWHATGSTELTLALHEDKDWSDSYAPRLPFLYLETKDALLAFAKQSHAAIKGRVTMTPGESGEDRAAQLDATITLTPSGAQGPGRSTAVQEAFGGTFFRLLVPGVEYCMEVAADGYMTQHAAVKLLEEGDRGETRGSELMHVFQMSRTRAEPVKTLGWASEEACAALRGPGGGQELQRQLGAAERRSGIDVLELECQEAELMDEADGSKSLTCINYCKGVDMKAGRGSISGFHVTCDT